MSTVQTIPITCEECGKKVPPDRGGMCSVCHRLLCTRHLHGLWGGLGVFSLRPAVCLRCRAEQKNEKDSRPL